MSYRITITKIESNNVPSRSYEKVQGTSHGIDVDKDGWGYVDRVIKKDVEEEVYRQTVEHQIPLMDVIKAFNNVDAASLL